MAEMPPHVKFRDLGRWYSLSFDWGEAPALFIQVYRPNIERISKWAHVNRKTLFYETDLAKGFGENRTFIAENSGEYLCLRAPFAGGNRAVEIAMDIADLLRLLRSARELDFRDFAHDSQRMQLMQITSGISVTESMGSAPIGGVVSPLMTEWLQAQGVRRLPNVEEAIWRTWNACAHSVHEKSEGPNPYGSIRVETRDRGGLMIGVTGDACGVSTDDAWRRTTREGNDLACHNMDGPVRQLCVLAGLAALHDLASQDLD